MEWLNYHHLLYFWTVAKEGGVGPAARVLHLTQPTVSGQIKALEESLEMKLFERVGRRLELTEDGRMVSAYAEEIFGLGKELMNAVRGRPTGRPLRLHVGISDALPKLVCHDLLMPAMRMEEEVQIICHGDKTERLLGALAMQELDLVLADEPVGSRIKVRAFNHLLGESGLTFFGTPDLARKYRRPFPESLDGAPLLLPTAEHVVRRALDQWFDEQGITPNVVAEFDDTGLLKSFGQGGEGLFISPTVVEAGIKKQYGVHVAGRTDAVTEKVYAITVERRIKHPAVIAISERAKNTLFADSMKST
jgi:LysR family transcriptional activator of nhaA